MVEAIAGALQVDVTFDGASLPSYLVRGRAATISAAGRAIGSVGMLAPADRRRGWIVGERRRVCGRARPRRADRGAIADAADGEAASPLSVDRARHLDRRRRHLARGNGSWHYPCGCAGHARLGARVRSVSRQRRARRARQPLASAHVPLARADADRCGSGDGDERDFDCAETQTRQWCRLRKVRQ